MTMISRRGMLRGTALTGAGLVACDLPGLGRMAFAQDGADRGLLVIVHLRGGCDGLNLISPATDPDFVAARASGLRVASDGKDAGHALANGPDPHIDFRLHPAAASLAEFYQAGHLAVIHAAGLTDGTRSHFVATDMIEHGVAGEGALNRENAGWLTRYLGGARVAGSAAAISATAGTSGDFTGSGLALAVPDLTGGFGVPGGPPVDQALTQLYASAPGPVGAAGRSALGAVQLLDSRILRDAQNRTIPYNPEGGAKYDQNSDLGRALKTVAQIAKMDVGLQVATVDIGGWDTHENQPGRFANCVQRLNAGIGAFYQDMQRHHDGLIIVTISEFGRRLRSNRSNGTDHGRAGVVSVLGGRVKGGRFYGRWPGMRSDQLDEGVDLAVTTDYRQILSEALIAHAGGGGGSGNVFPGYRDAKPLGIFA